MVSTFAGGIVAIRLSRYLGLIISLSGGMVVAVALIDVLPEAMRATGNPQRVGTLAALAFVVFFVAQRLVVLHHRHDTDQTRAHREVGALGATALSVHSFIDGLAIGLSFQLSQKAGIVVAVAIIAHDFADGVDTVSFVLAQGSRRRDALPWLLADAVAPMGGVLAGSLVAVSAGVLGQLLGAYAGVFLCIGAYDLLPRAHLDESRLRLALTCVGFVFIFIVVHLAL